MRDLQWGICLKQYMFKGDCSKYIMEDSMLAWFIAFGPTPMKIFEIFSCRDQTWFNVQESSARILDVVMPGLCSKFLNTAVCPLLEIFKHAHG